jgi:hypothetical protein
MRLPGCARHEVNIRKIAILGGAKTIIELAKDILRFLCSKLPNISSTNDLKSTMKLVPNDLLKTQTQPSWLRYASDALIEIMKICLEHNAKKIVVVGHGVIINLIGLIIEPEREKLLNQSFSPGEGLWLESPFSNKDKP